MSQKVKLDSDQSVRERVAALGRPWARSGGTPLDRAAAQLRKPRDRRVLARAGQLDALLRLAGDPALRAAPTGGPRVLMLSLRSWPNHLAFEGVIAQALRLRGAEVALLTCGGGMPACEMGWARHALPRPCDRCAFYTDRAVAGLGLRGYRLADTLPWGGDARDAPTVPPGANGIDPVDAAKISVPWFLRTADPESDPNGPAALNDFAVAAGGVETALERVLDQFQPDIVFMVNGLFGAESVARSLALARGLRAPTYEIAPRGGALVFSHGTPAPSYDTDAAWAAARDRPLTDDQRARVGRLLDDRARGVGAHESFFDSSEADRDVLRRQLGLPDGARVVSLFTNLSWDSATLFHDVAYPSMMDWIEDAIRAVAELPDTYLVIRVHPSEAKWGSREAVQDVMTARGAVAPNVRYVLPTDSLSSYALCDMSDLVLVYATTIGLEAATRGIKVAVAGDTHYRGRGFTYDLEQPSDLRAVLREPAGPMSDEWRELAWRYAFTFFYRCMIPFPAVRVDGHIVREVPERAAQIAPGADRYLDWICDRILDGGDFMLPDALAA